MIFAGSAHRYHVLSVNLWVNIIELACQSEMNLEWFSSYKANLKIKMFDAIPFCFLEKKMSGSRKESRIQHHRKPSGRNSVFRRRRSAQVRADINETRTNEDQRTFIPLKSLEGGIWNNISRMIKLTSPILVEGLGADESTAKSLYTSDLQCIAQTEKTYCKPAQHEPFVYQGDAFEVRVVGMQVSKYDQLLPGLNGNELFMYSTVKESNVTGDDIPFIHFDYKRDGDKKSQRPDTYIKIPDSKTFTYGITKQASEKKKSVNIQYRILEVDAPMKPIRQAVSGIEDMDGFVSGFGSYVPILGIVAPFLGIAGSVGKKMLHSYAKPDKVMTVDMNFSLADRDWTDDQNSVADNYLRYGYYFFLSEPYGAKLYASVHTPDNVRLLLHSGSSSLAPNGRLRRTKSQYDGFRKPEYIPLTGVNYIVIKVSRPTGDPIIRSRLKLIDSKRVEQVVEGMMEAGEIEENIRNNVFRVLTNTGIIESNPQSRGNSPYPSNGMNTQPSTGSSPNRPYGHLFNNPEEHRNETQTINDLSGRRPYATNSANQYQGSYRGNSGTQYIEEQHGESRWRGNPANINHQGTYEQVPENYESSSYAPQENAGQYTGQFRGGSYNPIPHNPDSRQGDSFHNPIEAQQSIPQEISSAQIVPRTYSNEGIDLQVPSVRANQNIVTRVSVCTDCFNDLSAACRNAKIEVVRRL